MNINNILRYTKSVVAFLGATLTFMLTVPGFTGLPPYVGSIGAVLTFIGVYLAKNKPITEEERDADEEYQPRRAYTEGNQDTLL